MQRKLRMGLYLHVLRLCQRMLHLHLLLSHILAAMFTQIKWIFMDDDSNIVLGGSNGSIYRWQPFNGIWPLLGG